MANNFRIQDGGQKKSPASNMELGLKQNLNSGAMGIPENEYANQKVVSLIARSQFKMAARKMRIIQDEPNVFSIQ